MRARTIGWIGASGDILNGRLPTRAERLAKAVEAQRRMIDLAVARIETRIDKLDLEAAIETCLPDRQATLGESFMNSPASSALPPAR